jgi:hypothetical protein
MNMRIIAVVVVAVIALSTTTSDAQSSEECGGDDPYWVLVTYIGSQFTVTRDDGIETFRTDEGSSSPMFLKTCEIADVGTIARDSVTTITLRRFVPSETVLSSYILVKETPAQICAAMPMCGDATAPVER